MNGNCETCIHYYFDKERQCKVVDAGNRKPEDPCTFYYSVKSPISFFEKSRGMTKGQFC